MRHFALIFLVIFQLGACTPLPKLADVHLPEGHELDSMDTQQLRQHYPHLLSTDIYFRLPGESEQPYQIKLQQLHTLWGQPQQQSQNWLDRLPSALSLGSLVYPDPLIALGVAGTATMLMPIPASSQWQGQHLRVSAYSHPLFKGPVSLRWFDKEGHPIHADDYQTPRGTLGVNIGRRIGLSRGENTVAQMPQRDVFIYSLNLERAFKPYWHGQAELSYNWSPQARSATATHRFQYSSLSMGISHQLWTHLRMGMAVNYHWGASVQTDPDSGSRFKQYRFASAPGMELLIDIPIKISRLQLAWQFRQFNTGNTRLKAQHLSLSARAQIF